MTVNLGPTFLSGALAANAGDVMDEPSCPLVQVYTEWKTLALFIHNTRPSFTGPIQTLCVECYLDPDQPAVHHVDHLPPEEAVQGLHQVKH